PWSLMLVIHSKVSSIPVPPTTFLAPKRNPICFDASLSVLFSDKPINTSLTTPITNPPMNKAFSFYCLGLLYILLSLLWCKILKFLIFIVRYVTNISIINTLHFFKICFSEFTNYFCWSTKSHHIWRDYCTTCYQ